MAYIILSTNLLARERHICVIFIQSLCDSRGVCCTSTIYRKFVARCLQFYFYFYFYLWFLSPTTWSSQNYLRHFQTASHNIHDLPILLEIRFSRFFADDTNTYISCTFLYVTHGKLKFCQTKSTEFCLHVSCNLLIFVFEIIDIQSHMVATAFTTWHYDDVIMRAMASQITSLTIVYSTVYSDADQRKHQSSASLAFVWGIHWGPVNSPHKWPVTRNFFPFDDVIMRNRLLL